MGKRRNFSDMLLGQRSRGICGLYNDITLPLSIESWRPMRTMLYYHHRVAAKIGLPLEADWRFGVSSRKKQYTSLTLGQILGHSSVHSPGVC